MSKWDVFPFSDLIRDETRYAKKIKQEDYLSEGKYQIIDQGQAQVAGYADDEEGLYKDVPAIIFGDHTRILKYVDSPFFLGADGVKLLKVENDRLDYKFLFYFLLNSNIPDTGYNRHFKWLKSLLISVPPIKTQKHISKVLDKTQEIIGGHKKQYEELDNLIKATFYDMFGDPVANEREWKIGSLATLACIMSGGTPSRAIPGYFEGSIPWITSVALNKLFVGDEDAVEHITEDAIRNSSTKIVKSSSVLFGIRVGVGKVSINSVAMCTSQDIVSITNFDLTFNKIFLAEMLKKFSSHFESLQRGATIKGITTEVLRTTRLIIPPIGLQNRFSEIVTNIETQKSLVKQSLTESQNLFNSLMSRYFD
jgi:type I restriction enzyme S subunit